MKKIYLFIIVAGLFTFDQANAQTNGRPKLGLGVDFAFPMGSYKSRANYGVGASILYQHPVTENLNITGNVGYLRFNGKEEFVNIKYKEGFVPIKAGARYFIAENFYGSGELGIVISTANGYGTGTAFAYSPGLGVAFPIFNKGSIDLGVRYEGWSRSNSTISFTGIRAGYNF